MFHIHLEDSAIRAALSALQQRLGSPASLMRAIATELESQTQQSFANQGLVGGEKWQGLSSVTQRLRAKRGQADSPILNISGGRGLLGSIMSNSTETTATVGAGSGKSAVYAAIHQFGGKAGRGRTVTIPARPYLPIQGDSARMELTPSAEAAILSLMRTLLTRLPP